VELDELDVGILRLLQEDARQSFRTLAERLKTTTPTVSFRVKRLEEVGIIQGYRVQVDPLSVGGTPHLLRLQVRPAALDKVADRLREMEAVEEILHLTGSSLVVRVRIRPPASTWPHIQAAIAELEDVLGYESWQVLRVTGQKMPDIRATGIEVTCHFCQGPIVGEAVRMKLGGREHVFCCAHCKRSFKERHKAMAES
jgi:Lrp/AsnC family transcriptional regulator, leucine-responsive regulatory protein